MAEEDSGHSQRRSLSGEDVDAGWDEEAVSLPDADAISVREEEASAPPEAAAISLRDDDLIEEAPSTKTVDSLEMRRLAARRSGAPPAASTPLPEVGSSAPPPRAELMATMPPPVPTSEYVAQMMGGHDDDAPESGLRMPPRYPKLPSLAERHRAILETLYEEDPLRFDFDDVATRPLSSPPISAGAPNSAPMIETEDVPIDDLDPELLKDTPVPQHPPGGGGGELDELDELPVDQVLAGLSFAPAQRTAAPGIFARRNEAHVPTMNEFPPLPGGVGAPVAAPLAGADDHERATLPGFDPEDPIDLLHDRFVGGDYDAALTLAEGILEVEPTHSEAQRYAESCRDMLRQMYLSRVGGGEQVPRVVMSPEQLRWLTLDHRTGFLLSCVDGQSSIDEILDVCGMPGLDAVRILFDLFEKGVVEMRSH